MSTVEVRKGSRVRARWFDAKPRTSLAGAQAKTSATEREVVGVVTRIRGDSPDKPTAVRLWVAPDDGGEVVQIQPEWIVEVVSHGR